MRHYVGTGLGRLHVDIREGSRRSAPILCWSGLFTDGRLWAEVSGRIPSRTWLLVDPPGHGYSDNLRRTFTVAECADAVADVLADSHAEAAVLVGLGWGGQACLDLAARRPDLVAGLGLVGTTAAAATAAEADRARSLLRRYRILGPLAIRSTVLKTSLSPAGHQDRSVVKSLSTQFRAAARPGLTHAMTSVLQAREELSPILTRVAAPAVVVDGAEDAVLGPGAADAVAAALPSLRGRRTVAGAGHLVPLENPAAVAEALEPLLH